MSLFCSSELVGQSDTLGTEEAIDHWKFSASLSHLIYRYPSLQGGVQYQYNSEYFVDLELGWLLPSENELNGQNGFRIHLGGKKKIGEKTLLTATFIHRNITEKRVEDFSKFGSYFEQIAFDTSLKTNGLSIGLIWNFDYDFMTLQVGSSFGAGYIVVENNVPPNSERVTNTEFFRPVSNTGKYPIGVNELIFRLLF